MKLNYDAFFQQGSNLQTSPTHTKLKPILHVFCCFGLLRYVSRSPPVPQRVPAGSRQVPVKYHKPRIHVVFQRNLSQNVGYEPGQSSTHQVKIELIAPELYLELETTFLNW